MSDIAVALIGGGAGLLTGAVTGAISSIIAPWANWGIEKKRLARERRVARIQEWREGVGNLYWSEEHHGSDFGQGPVSADVRTKGWFISLRPEITPDVVRQVEALSDKPILSRRGHAAELISQEISRIEREKWELI